MNNVYNDGVAFDRRLLLATAGGRVRVSLGSAAKWFRLAQEPPKGSRFRIANGPPDGFRLEGRRTYRFTHPIPALEIHWGTVEPWATDRAVELEWGGALVAPDGGAIDSPRAWQTLIARRGTTIPGGGVESFVTAPLPRWTSEIWDGATPIPGGAAAETPTAFVVFARSLTAGRVFKLQLIDDHLAAQMILAEADAVARPSLFPTVTLTLNLFAPVVQVGASQTHANPLVVETELWAIFK